MTHADLYAALIAFQSEMPTVTKNRQARGHDGRPYTYADLAAITAAANPVLHRHGLTFNSAPRVRDGEQIIVGTLRHVPTGTEVAAELRLHGRHMQDIGSGITYARRYLLGCLTGLVTDDDDDDASVTATSGAAAASAGDPEAALGDAMAAAATTEDLRAIYQAHGLGAAPLRIREAFYARMEELRAAADGISE